MSPFAVEALAEGVRALTRDPVRAAVFGEIDGTLGPVVDRADDAQAPGAVSSLLGALGRRCAWVARVWGSPRLTAALGQWRGPVCRFAAARDTRELRVLRIRIGDKGPIAAFHWRGVPGEDAALGHLPGRRGGGGAPVQWGRKVREVRPPVPIEKGAVGARPGRGEPPHVALFGGSDVTGLDAFDVLDALVADGRPGSAVRVGVPSEEGPGDMVIRAGLLADGAEGFVRVREGLLRAAR